MLRRRTLLADCGNSHFVIKYVLIALLALTFTTGRTQAGTVTGYVNNPTGNSTDFSAALGGSVTTLDVGTLTTGALNPAAFFVSNGVTLAGTGNFAIVSSGAGPGQANVSAPPLSPGEGPHAPANFIGGSTTSGTLTVSFNTPVLGAGLFLIDLFNPGGGPDNVTIQAFAGAGGTGTLLGTFLAVGDNFQPNNLYFMGITSSGGDIGSIVLTQPNNPSGDVIGLGNILYGSGAPTQTPESAPGILMLIGSGLVILVMRRR